MQDDDPATLEGDRRDPRNQAPAEDLSLMLPDGRRMGYALYGEKDGRPVIACHGTPGSRLMLRFADPGARRLGLRLIAPDRPGYGLSSPSTGSSIAAWVQDLEILARNLGLETWAMVGISGGGPYALACAALLPQHVRFTASISGLAPLDRQDLLLDLTRAQRALFTAADMMAGRLAMVAPRLGGLRSSAVLRWILRQAARFAAAPEQSVLLRSDIQAMLVACFAEGLQSGGAGVSADLSLFRRPWQFRIEDIQTPVMLWHGDADGIVPAAMGRFLARRLPACTAQFLPGSGHYWILNHIDDVLGALRERLDQAVASADDFAARESLDRR